MKIGELCLSSSIGHIGNDKLLIDARGTYKMHLARLNRFFFLGFLERGDLENDFVSLDMENNGFQEGKKFSVWKWLPCGPFKRLLGLVTSCLLLQGKLLGSSGRIICRVHLCELHHYLHSKISLQNHANNEHFGLTYE